MAAWSHMPVRGYGRNTTLIELASKEQAIAKTLCE